MLAGDQPVLVHNNNKDACWTDDDGNEWADPEALNFSQRTISPNNYADSMRAGEWDWNRPGTPLRIMDVDGHLESYDNRRLDAGRDVGAPVRIERVNADDPFPDNPALTWGEMFENRRNDPRNVRAGGAVPVGGLYDRPAPTNRRRR